MEFTPWSAPPWSAPPCRRFGSLRLVAALLEQLGPRFTVESCLGVVAPSRHRQSADKAAQSRETPTAPRMTYSQTFTDHLENPRNAGELPDADAIGEETNPVCGDRLRLSLRVVNERIEAARFLAYGCPPTLVCGSVMTELIYGKTVEEALSVTRKNLIAAIGGLPSRKQHAAALAVETLRAALESACSRLLRKS